MRMDIKPRFVPQKYIFQTYYVCLFSHPYETNFPLSLITLSHDFCWSYLLIVYFREFVTELYVGRMINNIFLLEAGTI